MWLGPVLFIAVSVFLWRYIGAVFVPELLARSIFRVVPLLSDIDFIILINAAVLYFGAYFIFAIFWKRLKPLFKSPFLAAVILWLANVTVILPMLGRGLFGYRTPQGWIAASLPLFVSHWLFARGLQFQDRRS